MSDEATAAGTGAAGGAVAGAAAGTMVMPGIGTAVGAGVGALAGGAAGYLGARGASKRRKAQEEARQKYLMALGKYREIEVARSRQREALLTKQSGQAHDNFQTYMGNKPGDQSASLQHDAANQSAALYSAQAPSPELAGPLAGQYQAEMGKRVGNEVNSTALDYSADQQNYAGDQNERDYGLAESALSRDRQMFEQQATLGTAQSEAEMQKAAAEFGVDRQRAQGAGSEQMLYGGLVNAGIGLGNQYAGAKRRSALYNQGYGEPKTGNPALTQSDQDWWNSRVPLRNNGSQQA